MTSPIRETAGNSSRKIDGCYHCGLPVETDSFRLQSAAEELHFCCNGCKNAYLLIQQEGLGSYYQSRTDFASRPDEKQMPEEALYRALEDRIASKGQDGEQSFLEGTFLIRGIHCASCVWLNEKILRNIDGVISAEVQLVTSRVHLKWNPEKTDLARLARAVSKVGYRLLPVQEKENVELKKASVSLLKKMAVAGFFTGNIMLISFSLYAGMFSFMDELTKQFFHFVAWLMATPVYLYSASEFFKAAWASIRNRVLGMDILTASGLSLAYFYSVYVTLTGKGEVFFDAVCFVVFAILIGRFLESRIRLKTWYYTHNLISHIPDFARLLNAGVDIDDLDEESQVRITPLEDVRIGDRFVVRNGEALPVDGRLLSESAETDESALTGEFRPRQRKAGEILTAGSRAAGEKAIVLEATSTHATSTLTRIMSMAEESLRDRPRSERIASRAAAIFIGFVLLAGVATFFYWFEIRNDLPGAILHTLSLLIVACPCALSLSIPTAILVAMQRSFSRGCLIHKAEHLEILAKAKHFAFDKTGTITTGKMHVSRIDGCSAGKAPEYLLLAAQIQASTGIEHPLATAFIESAPKHQRLRRDDIETTYLTGRGVQALVPVNIAGGGADSFAKAAYHLGSLPYLEELGYGIGAVSLDGIATPVGFGRTLNGQRELLCVFQLQDTIRPEAASVVAELNKAGDTELLTGDGEQTAALVTQGTGLRSFQASMTPEQKRDRIAELRKTGVTVMLGDGVNDTVALSAAHVGITFAEASRLALYSADILLLKPDLRLLTFMTRLSRRTRMKIVQNLSISFGYNVLLLPLAFFGYITPLLGAIFMSLSSICVVLNSLTLMRAGAEETPQEP